MSAKLARRAVRISVPKCESNRLRSPFIPSILTGSLDLTQAGFAIWTAVSSKYGLACAASGGVTSANIEKSVDLAHLFRLRLVVARHGEMDLAKWWNTNGMLGRRGAVVLQRGFPRTHFFAQARAVFAVAQSRCAELFDPPGRMTLWQLPAEIEDRFEDEWHQWLDHYEEWAPFFERLQQLPGADLLDELTDFDLIGVNTRETLATLSKSPEGRAIALPGIHEPNDEVVTLLAAAFARSEPGSLLIPYARLDVTP